MTDVVAELDRWLEPDAPVHFLMDTAPLMQRARDEIIAQRQIIQANDDEVAYAARFGALEEAAHLCKRRGFGEMASAILALENKRWVRRTTDE